MKQNNTNFEYFLEQFADIKIMRFEVPGFDNLSHKQKLLIYYLSEAALCGRDIIFDQHYKHNLMVRKALETIHKFYSGDRDTENYRNFLVYLKRIWFSNGIHHHYSTDKIIPGFSKAYFEELMNITGKNKFHYESKETFQDFIESIASVIFDPDVAPKRVSLDDSNDLVVNSACNFYENVTQQEVEEFYHSQKDPEEVRPVSYGLNSKLVKKDGKITEYIYKENGLYSRAIEKIIHWLEKAAGVAENEQQVNTIEALVSFYRTGDLKTFDLYNVLWVNDLDSEVDFVNGFIEVYGDPLGLKATWESVVNFKDAEATRRAEIISSNAQWFEDNSPVDERFKKKEVRGVSAKVITVAQLGGDCYPATPIGINLPNADWIRKEHGSKSVTMENITYAYNKVTQGSGFLEEFCLSQEEVDLAKKYGALAGNLHTDLHECLGHGSGQLLPGTSPEALKNYGSPLEEARADLFALYYIMDQKLVDLGIMPNPDVAKAEYNGYIRNGLMTQLTRIDPGKTIEQAHMRNRQLVAKWCFEKGRGKNVIEQINKDGKTYYKINDYNELRKLFGVLLKEIQRIKSEGDFEAGKHLVEQYGILIDPDLHKEVRERYEKLNLAPYGGFINPEFAPVIEKERIVDIKIRYPESYEQQMLKYSENYSFL